jgi:chemotaxis protein histidine kinase CheA
VDAELRPGTVPVASVNSRLWRTFQRELTGRVAQLKQCVAEAKKGERGEELFRGAARTLHTTKSAAMVVPVEQVTRCTHLVEELVESARAAGGPLPHETLSVYLDWLEALAAAWSDLPQVLADGARLEARWREAAGAATT